MELKVCPNPRTSASAAEFNVSPARRESSSKALFEPLEMLKYCWVFPLAHHPSVLRSRQGLLVPSAVGDPASASPWAAAPATAARAAAVRQPAKRNSKFPRSREKPNLLKASKCQGFFCMLF